MKPVDHNRRAWDRLARSGMRYTRPEGPLPKTTAAIRDALVTPGGHLAGMRLNGARVLAGGGGLHGIMFAKLGASTTVLDISRVQVATVKALARQHDAQVKCVQGDMNDLSRFREASFEIVWHIHSLVFVPDARRVFREVGRVLAPGGIYRMTTVQVSGSTTRQLRLGPLNDFDEDRIALCAFELA